jgi:hypothetical protein
LNLFIQRPHYLAFKNFFCIKFPKSKFCYLCGGEMAEWSNAAVLKTVVRVTGPGVRIPLSPPKPPDQSPATRGFSVKYQRQTGFNRVRRWYLTEKTFGF